MYEMAVMFWGSMVAMGSLAAALAATTEAMRSARPAAERLTEEQDSFGPPSSVRFAEAG